MPLVFDGLDVIDTLDKVETLGFIHIVTDLDEIIQRKSMDLSAVPEVDGYCTILDFFITEDNDTRYLVILEVLDLIVHMGIIKISFDMDMISSQELGNSLCIFIVFSTDGNDAYLCRCDPERESALEVLDQKADESHRSRGG